MLATAIGALGTPSPQTKSHLQTFFASSSSATAAAVRANLQALRNHITANTSGARVRCHTELDGGCSDKPAYNQGTGSTAVMTLCPSFLDNPANVVSNSATLIHEAAHGTAGLATQDIAYGHTRLIHTLTTAQALQNSDSYVLLVRNLVAGAAGATGPPGGVASDTVTGLSAGRARIARAALAHLEK